MIKIKLASKMWKKHLKPFCLIIVLLVTIHLLWINHSSVLYGIRYYNNGHLFDQFEQPRVLLNPGPSLMQDNCVIKNATLYPLSYLSTVRYVNMSDCKDEDEISELRIKDDMLQIISSVEEKYHGDMHCCIYDILRPHKLASDSFIRSNCDEINIKIPHNVSQREYFAVKCAKDSLFPTSYSQCSKVTDFYAKPIVTSDEILRKIEYWKQNSEEKPVNILIVVVDSTTRVDAYRFLPKALKYLLEDLQFIDFKGHHILGEPTMPNAIPLLMGISREEFEKKLKPKWKDYWDEFPFIWKDFHNQNYITGYIEDKPRDGTFNYGGQSGFLYRPTDIYPRPLTIAYVEKKRESIAKDKMCVGRRNIVKFFLDYQYDLLKKFVQVPTFFIPWFCFPQHDFYTTLAGFDDTYLEFFQNLANTTDNNNILENTVIIFMGDHGFRYHDFTKTPQGLSERRLPLFMARLPERLTIKFPQFAKAIKENSQRITSHYDIYQTLAHLLRLAGGTVSNSRLQNLNITRPGQSLLEPLPETRTCAEAHIPQDCCACNK